MTSLDQFRNPQMTFGDKKNREVDLEKIIGYNVETQDIPFGVPSEYFPKDFQNQITPTNQPINNNNEETLKKTAKFKEKGIRKHDQEIDLSLFGRNVKAQTISDKVKDYPNPEQNELLQKKRIPNHMLEYEEMPPAITLDTLKFYFLKNEIQRSTQIPNTFEYDYFQYENSFENNHPIIPKNMNIYDENTPGFIQKDKIPGFIEIHKKSKITKKQTLIEENISMSSYDPDFHSNSEVLASSNKYPSKGDKFEKLFHSMATEDSENIDQSKRNIEGAQINEKIESFLGKNEKPMIFSNNCFSMIDAFISNNIQISAKKVRFTSERSGIQKKDITNIIKTESDVYEEDFDYEDNEEIQESIPMDFEHSEKIYEDSAIRDKSMVDSQYSYEHESFEKSSLMNKSNISFKKPKNSQVLNHNTSSLEFSNDKVNKRSPQTSKEQKFIKQFDHLEHIPLINSIERIENTKYFIDSERIRKFEKIKNNSNEDCLKIRNKILETRSKILNDKKEIFNLAIDVSKRLNKLESATVRKGESSEKSLENKIEFMTHLILKVLSKLEDIQLNNQNPNINTEELRNIILSCQKVIPRESMSRIARPSFEGRSKDEDIKREEIEKIKESNLPAKPNLTKQTELDQKPFKENITKPSDKLKSLEFIDEDIASDYSHEEFDEDISGEQSSSKSNSKNKIMPNKEISNSKELSHIDAINKKADKLADMVIQNILNEIPNDILKRKSLPLPLTIKTNIHDKAQTQLKSPKSPILEFNIPMGSSSFNRYEVEKELEEQQNSQEWQNKLHEGIDFIGAEYLKTGVVKKNVSNQVPAEIIDAFSSEIAKLPKNMQIKEKCQIAKANLKGIKPIHSSFNEKPKTLDFKLMYKESLKQKFPFEDSINKEISNKFSETENEFNEKVINACESKFIDEVVNDATKFFMDFYTSKTN